MGARTCPRSAVRSTPPIDSIGSGKVPMIDMRGEGRSLSEATRLASASSTRASDVQTQSRDSLFGLGEGVKLSMDQGLDDREL